jgi:signal transduction histidine kinase
MTTRTWIERGAIAVVAVLLLLGTLIAVAGHEDPGIHFAQRDDGFVVVTSVNAYSPGEQNGIQPGMIAINLNGQDLVRLPEYVYASPEPTANPDTGEIPEPSPIGIDPPKPTLLDVPPSTIAALINAPLTRLDAVTQDGLDTWTAGGGTLISIGDNGRSSVRDSLWAVIVAFLLFVGSAYWLGTGRAGPQLRSLAYPLGLAMAAPIALIPLGLTWSPALVALVGILGPLASVPLAWLLIERIDAPAERRLAAFGAAGFLAIGIAFGVTRIWTSPWEIDRFAYWIVPGGIAALPGLLAAGPLVPGATWHSTAPGGEATASGRLLRSTELAVVGATPAMAFATTLPPYLLPIALWLAAIAIAGRFTVRPLARLATRAQLQRDLVVAATEAERARVAADIHDDALQELTLLVRRLDASGDNEGAEIARGVSDRLRAICGDLRLPILDDLGVGPALDWLAQRMERLAGGEVRLERDDGTRLPPDVELAFFRVAQEALANAVKHGRPPIVVRYRSTPAGASLAVDDSGPGISPDATDRAEREGRYGLLTMQQRAEGIGAILDVRRWPKGGTHVQLEWRAR